jgi:two-component system sensor histidine kinase/response regulator
LSPNVARHHRPSSSGAELPTERSVELLTTERPSRVLVIDDSATIRAEITGILEASGYAVTTAADGRQGLSKLWRCRPDLILCDLGMPELDGFEVLRALRARPDWAIVPFVCLTARSERAAMRRAMEMGADDYVVKPVTATELLSAVGAGLEKRARVEHEAAERLGDLRRSITLALPHEFRTPLSIVLGYSELLMDAADERRDDELRSIGRSVLAAATQLHRLTENFLLYAQLELSARQPDARALFAGMTPAPVHEIVEQAAREAASNGRRDADLALDLQYACVELREALVRKIVTELVDNAFKFSEPGAAVRATVEADGDVARITIADHGCGMSAEQVAALGAYLQFDRVVREQQGMGLGLGIVRRIAEISGGASTVVSDPGTGTTVCVTLPLATDPPAAA